MKRPGGHRKESARHFRLGALWTLVAPLTLASCGQTPGSADAPLSYPGLTDGQLLDPLDAAGCEPCHPTHYREWSGSMHAYAAEDPVFLAMNARAQRETEGAIGDFCVQCHAPMAVFLGATQDGLNLAEVPEALKGVTCAFCHLASDVQGSHNNPLALALDPSAPAARPVFRGGIDDPIHSPVHGAVSSPLHQSDHPKSAALCGSCHDVVTHQGLHVERTFLEWQSTQYADASPCGSCHMPAYTGRAARLDGAPKRTVHSHSMAAVDLALTPFPQADAQRLAATAGLKDVLFAKLCVDKTPEGTRISVTLRNRIAGHSFPSGSAQHRRGFLELLARAGERTVLEVGAVSADEALDLDDPALWWLGDRLFDETGSPTHDFWRADSYEAQTLPGPLTSDPQDPRYAQTAQTRTYWVQEPGVTDVSMRIRLRALDRSVLSDLIESGDLAANFSEGIPEYELSGTQLAWTQDLGGCVASRFE